MISLSYFYTKQKEIEAIRCEASLEIWDFEEGSNKMMEENTIWSNGASYELKYFNIDYYLNILWFLPKSMLILLLTCARKYDSTTS